MDNRDLMILNLLQENASITVAEISSKVHLSPTPCWRRIQKMEEAGIIRRRVALLDGPALGFGLTVFVDLSVASHDVDWLREFRRFIGDSPEVMEVHRIAGDVDYMLRLAVRDMDEYDAFYLRLIERIPVKEVVSRFSMERIKATTAFPIRTGALNGRTPRSGQA